MKIRLVSDWRHAWRWSSMRVGAVLTALAAYFLQSPDVLFTVVTFIPADIRLPAAFAAFGFVCLLRVTQFAWGKSDGEE